MFWFIQLLTTSEELVALNQCRLYLQAYFVSDLATASGKTLSYHAWEGTLREYGHTNRCIWPHQGTPSRASWDVWRKFVKSTILARRLRLKRDLGPRLRKDLDTWPWYFSPSLDGLIQITLDGTILLHSRQIPFITRKNFQQIGTPIHQLLKDLQKASVKRSRKNTWWLIDTGNFVPSYTVPSYEDFFSYIEGNSPLNPWCFEDIEFPEDYLEILQDLNKGTVRLVCHGSFNPSSDTGAAAWTLEGISTSVQIWGKIVTPGDATDHLAYRSELAGIRAAMTVINSFTSFHGISSLITIHCDCQTAIEKAFDSLMTI
jgi:hypothetical protein